MGIGFNPLPFHFWTMGRPAQNTGWKPQGYGTESLPINIRGFMLPIVDNHASVGTGFLYPICSEMGTIPEQRDFLEEDLVA